jgi:putative restriction endonuclease
MRKLFAWTKCAGQTKNSHRPIAPNIASQICPAYQDGNGLQSVYLAAIPVPMAGVLMQASPELGNASKTVGFEMENAPVNRVEDQVEATIRNDTTIDSTEKHELALDRRGQGKFRQNLEQIEGC